MWLESNEHKKKTHAWMQLTEVSKEYKTLTHLSLASHKSDTG